MITGTIGMVVLEPYGQVIGLSSLYITAASPEVLLCMLEPNISNHRHAVHRL